VLVFIIEECYTFATNIDEATCRICLASNLMTKETDFLSTHHIHKGLHDKMIREGRKPIRENSPRRAILHSRKPIGHPDTHRQAEYTLTAGKLSTMLLEADQTLW
jgi:hypothetical protein